MAIVSSELKDFPIGVSDYEQLITEYGQYIDKSLMIKDIFDDGSLVQLITRPRRFGKTLNMSMLKYFYALTPENQRKRNLFDHSILNREHPTFVEEHQGQYPLIYLSFKDIKTSTYDRAESKLHKIIKDAYEEDFQFLLQSDHLTHSEKQTIQSTISGPIDFTSLADSLRDLSKFLYKHYQQRVFILIDEYDTPIQHAYLNDYYDQMIELMQSLLTAALKDNRYLKKGVLTGILRISKESIFSGLNNLKVNTVLDEPFCEYFGFTVKEVTNLLKRIDRLPLNENLKAWYNGYLCGNQTLYNPWSILSCLHNKGKYETYWAGTSSNQLIRDLLTRSSVKLKSAFAELISGNEIEVAIDPYTNFAVLKHNEKDSDIWHVMLASGYLTATVLTHQGTKVVCRLKMPNQETHDVFKDIIVSWFDDVIGHSQYEEMINALMNGDVEIFFNIIRAFLLESASYHDFGGQAPEQVYHVLILGTLIGIQQSSTHALSSNLESGYGRYDLAIVPTSNAYHTAVIFEFKATKNKEDDLKAMANQALEQINRNEYEAGIQKPHIKKIIKVGMAFNGKRVEMSHDVESG